MKLGLGQKAAAAFRKSAAEQVHSDDSNEKEYMLAIIQAEDEFKNLIEAYNKFFKNLDLIEPRGDHLEFQKKLNEAKALPCISMTGRVRLKNLMEEYKETSELWKEKIRRNNQRSSTAIRVQKRLIKERQKKFKQDAETFESNLLDNLYGSLVSTAQVDVSKLCRKKFDSLMKIKIRELYKKAGRKVRCEIVVKNGKIGLVPSTTTEASLQEAQAEA